MPRRACLIAVAALVAGCGGGAGPPPPTPGAGCAHRAPSETCGVLFVGNSLTFVNDLPATFTKLAASGGRAVTTGMAATGGATLADHVAQADAAAHLRERTWNVVSLQEQSQIPSVPELRAGAMYPAARTLVGAIRAARAQPLLFLTWARADGWAERGLIGYRPMQDAIDDGYLTLARSLGVPVAPVGVAWAQAQGDAALPSLFDPDGNHPSIAGTYLAACVFYATIFRASPAGLGFSDGLPADVAARLQAAAARAVLG